MTRPRKMLVSAFALLVATGVTAACGSGDAGNGSGDSVSWSLQSAFPPGHWWIELHEEFADEVSAATDGQFDIRVVPAAGDGIPPAEALSYASDGRVDMIEIAPSYVSGTWYDSNIDALMFFYTDWAAAAEGYQLLEDEFASELSERFNSVYLYGGPSDTHYVLSKDRIATMEDFAGAIFRVPGSNYADLFNAVPGSSASVIPLGETYTALQRGTVNGVVSTATATVANSWDEVIDHVLLVPVSHGSGQVIVNQASYDELPVEFQEALTTAGNTMRDRWLEVGAEVDESALETLESEGTVEFVEDENGDVRHQLQEIAEPQWESWASGGDKAEEWLQMLKDAGLHRE